MRLGEMEPRGNLSSTGYVLAAPGEEYLILQPSETAEPFAVTLEAGMYSVQWYSVSSRETVEVEDLSVESLATINLTDPFAAASPAVVYLKKIGP
jgi:hypothetical protein